MWLTNQILSDATEFVASANRLPSAGRSHTLPDSITLSGSLTMTPLCPFVADRAVAHLVYLPATKGFATAAFFDPVVSRWTSAGALEATLEGHLEPVTGLVAWGNNGLVSCCNAGTVVVWEGTKRVAVLTDHKEAVTAVAVHPRDANIVYSASLDTTVRRWDVASAVCTAVLDGHSSSVNSVAVLADGAVVSGSGDCTVRVWGHDGVCQAVLPQPASVATVAAVGGDGFLLSTSESTKLVRKSQECWTRAHAEHLISKPPCLQAPNLVKVMDDEADRVVGEVRCPSSCFDGLRAAAMGNGKLLVLFRTPEVRKLFTVKVLRPSRFRAVDALHAAWGLHAGTPPRLRLPADSPLAALARTLSLRRFCRVRGPDDLGMPFEVVEPFGRAVLSFL